MHSLQQGLEKQNVSSTQMRLWKRLWEQANKWQFPNCIGAMDGKHLVMQPPPEATSKHHNYEHTHSIILLAVVGPNYECIYADVGTNGRVSDGGVWSTCSLARKIENNPNFLPPPRGLPSGSDEVSFAFVADDAFALKEIYMKPYPQAGITDMERVYNYRLSRARRISENMFGIIANRWCVFRSTILIPLESIAILTLATLALHNFLRQSASNNIYCRSNPVDAIGKTGEIIPVNHQLTH